MRVSVIAIAGIMAASAAFAGGKNDAPGQGDNTNWGQLTAGAIAGGFEQGTHSSDPSGDGHGPGTADEPRTGLANVIPGGDLGDTINLIDCLFNGNC